MPFKRRMSIRLYEHILPLAPIMMAGLPRKPPNEPRNGNEKRRHDSDHKRYRAILYLGTSYHT